MNEKLKEFAEQAGLIKMLNEHASEYSNGYYVAEDYPEIERFVELVTQEGREACALRCEELGAQGYGTLYIAAAIRKGD
jgi:hypothetical protein